MINNLSRLGSRKLSGLVLTLLALLAVLTAYIVASLFVNVSEVVITAITTAITSIGGGHQAAQALADRSPNYPAPPQQYAGVPPEQGGQG